MRTNLSYIFTLLFLFSIMSLSAQDGDKEIIIIEKSIDADGNEISRSTKRLKGSYTEEQIQDMIESEYDAGPSIRSFDLDGMGFEDEMDSFFGGVNDAKPTIGVHLDFEDGQATVHSVVPGSSAQDADIRAGDLLIMINNQAISTIEDVYDVLERKKIGDQVAIVIFRDGQELEKQVTLKGGSRRFSFEFPEEGGMMHFFGEHGDDLRSQMDSLMRHFFENGDLFNGMDMDTPFGGLGDGRKGYDRHRDTRERASLGVFLDEGSEGTVIADVVPHSPADKVNLKIGDKILRMDDNIVGSYREISAYMNRKKVGDALDLMIERDGKKMSIRVDL